MKWFTIHIHVMPQERWKSKCLCLFIHFWFCAIVSSHCVTSALLWQSFSIFFWTSPIVVNYGANVINVYDTVNLFIVYCEFWLTCSFVSGTVWGLESNIHELWMDQHCRRSSFLTFLIKSSAQMLSKYLETECKSLLFTFKLQNKM